MRSVSRRTLLRGSALGVAALTVAGCASEEPKPVVAAPPDPETVLLNQLIAGKERTVALYASAASAKLAPFAERHEAHLAELRRRLRDKLLSSASSAAVPFSPPSPASTPLSPSGTPHRAAGPPCGACATWSRRQRRSAPASSPGSLPRWPS